MKNCVYIILEKIVDQNLNIIYNHIVDVNRSIYANFGFNQVAESTMVFNRKLLEYVKMNSNENPHMYDSYMYRLCAAMGGEFIVDAKGKIMYRQHIDNVVGLRRKIPTMIDSIIGMRINARNILRESVLGYIAYAILIGVILYKKKVMMYNE